MGRYQPDTADTCLCHRVVAGHALRMELRRVVVMTIFAPFVLLMAREAVAAVDQLRAEPTHWPRAVRRLCGVRALARSMA